MPGDGWKLPLEQMQAIEEWIALGAHWPKGEAGALKVKEYKIEIPNYL